MCVCAFVRVRVCMSVFTPSQSSIVLLHGPVTAPSLRFHPCALPDVSYCPEGWSGCGRQREVGLGGMKGGHRGERQRRTTHIICLSLLCLKLLSDDINVQYLVPIILHFLCSPATVHFEEQRAFIQQEKKSEDAEEIDANVRSIFRA